MKVLFIYRTGRELEKAYLMTLSDSDGRGVVRDGGAYTRLYLLLRNATPLTDSDANPLWLTRRGWLTMAQLLGAHSFVIELETLLSSEIRHALH